MDIHGNDDRYPRVPMPTQRCQHITCKGMLVYGDDYKTPIDERSRSNDFWCQQTQSVLGPDGALVTLSRCSTERKCYEEL